MSTLPEPFPVGTLKKTEEYWELVEGTGVISARLNSKNKNGTSVILIDSGGWNNNTTSVGEVVIGNPTSDNDKLKVHGDGVVSKKTTADVVSLQSGGIKVGALSQSGISTTFLTQSGDTVTVVDGIIVSVA